jgi:hypothetical protein
MSLYQRNLLHLSRPHHNTSHAIQRSERRGRESVRIRCLFLFLFLFLPLSLRVSGTVAD